MEPKRCNGVASLSRATFPKSRWLTSCLLVSESALLASCHHLLTRVVPFWLKLLRGQNVASFNDASAVAIGDDDAFDDWVALSDSDAELEDDGAASSRAADSNA